MDTPKIDETVINGFALDVQGKELAEYAKRRADHHQKRADMYEAEVAKIRELKKGDDEETQMISKFNNRTDPVEELTKSAAMHGKRARFFGFASEHFVGDRTYRLRQADLELLEIFPTRGY